MSVSYVSQVAYNQICNHFIMVYLLLAHKDFLSGKAP